jgi:hypothetical protein
VPGRRRGGETSVALDRGGERRLGQGDDDLDEPDRGRRRPCGRAACEEQRKRAE